MGQSSADTALGYNNLAELLRARGDLAGAEELLRKALAIPLEIVAGQHRRAVIYNNLANVLLDRRDLTGAEEMFRKALAIKLEFVGERAPNTAMIYGNIARVLYARGKLVGSEAMHRKALAIRIEVLGERHPETGASYDGLGRVLADLNRSSEAIQTLEAAAVAATEARRSSARGLEAHRWTLPTRFRFSLRCSPRPAGPTTRGTAGNAGWRGRCSTRRPAAPPGR